MTFAAVCLIVWLLAAATADVVLLVDAVRALNNELVDRRWLVILALDKEAIKHRGSRSTYWCEGGATWLPTIVIIVVVDD